MTPVIQFLPALGQIFAVIMLSADGLPVRQAAMVRLLDAIEGALVGTAATERRRPNSHAAA